MSLHVSTTLQPAVTSADPGAIIKIDQSKQPTGPSPTLDTRPVQTGEITIILVDSIMISPMTGWFRVRHVSSST